MPWLALAVLEALFFGVGLALIAVVLRWGPRVWPTTLGRLGMVPVVVAGLWTAREAIAAVWPYGGFAWGRVALSQSESPFGPLVAWVGMSGLSFLMVWLSALVDSADPGALISGWRPRWGIAVASRRPAARLPGLADDRSREPRVWPRCRATPTPGCSLSTRRARS